MIGVFGGTFDPVHNGHLRIALDAMEALALEQVRLVPLARAVHRDQPQATARQRLEMLEAGVAGHPGFVVDDREIRRAGPSYTVETLRSLQADFPHTGLCLLLGGDAFNGLAGWREPEAILALANIALLARPGHRLRDKPGLTELIGDRWVTKLDLGRTGQVIEVPVTQLDIAASDIRQRLQRGLSAAFLVPERVLALVARHRLYGADRID